MLRHRDASPYLVKDTLAVAERESPVVLHVILQEARKQVRRLARERLRNLFRRPCGIQFSALLIMTAPDEF